MATQTPNRQVEMPFEPVLESALVQALAKVRAVPVTEIRSRWYAKGDIDVKSIEAEAVVVFVEDALGEGEFAEVADLAESQLTSLRSLGQLLQSQRPLTSGATT